MLEIPHFLEYATFGMPRFARNAKESLDLPNILTKEYDWPSKKVVKVHTTLQLWLLDIWFSAAVTLESLRLPKARCKSTSRNTPNLLQFAVREDLESLTKLLLEQCEDRGKANVIFLLSVSNTWTLRRSVWIPLG